MVQAGEAVGAINQLKEGAEATCHGVSLQCQCKIEQISSVEDGSLL